MSADKVNNNKLTINNFDRLLGEKIYFNYIINKVERESDVYKMEATYYHTIDQPPHKIHIHITRGIFRNNISSIIYWKGMYGSAVSDTINVPLDEIRDMGGWLGYMGEEVRKLVGM